MCRWTHVLALISCITIPSAYSQSSAIASLHGVVTDPSGAQIAGATINVKPTGNEALFTTSTGKNGEFNLSGLAPGSYLVTAEQMGFNKVYKTVMLTASQTTNVTIELRVNVVNQSVTVTAQTAAVTEEPTAQTITSVGYQDTKDSADFTIQEALDLVPGVTTITGNGPRDISISLRGSNDRQSYGIRNAILFDDGFQVTQPDGLGRADLVDPHAYGLIDAVQGPSSTMYGNDAVEGAIFFYTRPGASIGGVDLGTDAGSYGYLNNYISIGNAGQNYDYSVFLSNVLGKQSYQDHFAFDTATANILATVSLRPQDRLIFKFINNDLDTELPIRLSLNQYLANPFQRGCEVYSSANTSCVGASVYVNGFTGTKVTLSADQLGLGRHDRRTVVGARWEHDLTANTTLRTQVVWDDKDIDQPTGSTSARGSTPSFIFLSDGTRKGRLFGRDSTTYAGAFFKYEDTNSNSYNVMPGGNATLGAYVSGAFGTIVGTGIHGQEEINLGPRVTLVGGIGYEHTSLSDGETLYSYSATASPSTNTVNADRTYDNISPEAAILLRVSNSLRLHARLGTGYATPVNSAFFITPQGTYGNNSQLKAATNIGIDLGGEWTASRTILLNLTGFYERYANENVTQSPGAGLLNYTFNAPSSAHRGMVAGIDWHPLPEIVDGLRLRAAYQLDDQVYRQYTERLSAGNMTSSFIRNGNRIPGVIPNNLSLRGVYDLPTSRYGEFGTYLETNYRSAFWLDNANLLDAPSSTILNFDVHYDPAAGHGFWSRTHFYFDLQNLANRTYIGSASNISDTINSSTGLENPGYGSSTALAQTGTGSIYAGAPRLSIGGFRIKF